jgi:hypothetical protein
MFLKLLQICLQVDAFLLKRNAFCQLRIGYYESPEESICDMITLFSIVSFRLGKQYALG